MDVGITASLEQELSRLSGVAPERIRAMTLADVVPLAGDDNGTARASFQQYITGFSVLPKGVDCEETPLKSPLVPWQTNSQSKLVCPDCLLSDDAPYIRLTWAMELTTTCPVHGLRLVTNQDRRAALEAAWESGEWLPRIPASSEDILQLDRMTSLAIRRKEVPLPGGRSMAGTTWLQFLRAFIDELMRVEEHQSYQWLCDDEYATIWKRAGYPLPNRANIFNTFEEGGKVFKYGFMRAAAAGVAMILSGHLMPVATKARALSPR